MTKKKLQIELECNPDKEKGRAPMSWIPRLLNKLLPLKNKTWESKQEKKNHMPDSLRQKERNPIASK
jgi:hypothetical protein